MAETGARARVLVEVLRNRFQAIANEMASVILRTGHTVFIKETADFGSALVSPTGELFACPLHLGVSVMLGMPAERAFAKLADYQEGDVGLTNDPYTSGGLVTHLPDMFLWKPIFHRGELVCYALGFVHSSDVGGKVPGSISPTNDNIFQEGLRIPPRKLVRAGQLDAELVELILTNCRIPDQNWGDLKAVLASLNVGERRVHELIARYGLDAFRAGLADVLDYGEARARAVIGRLPEGSWEFWDYMEGDVFGAGPIRVHLRLSVRDGGVHLDFTGTDGQVRGALNMPTEGYGGPHYMIVPGVVNYLRTQDPLLPFNSGLTRPITIQIPRGSLLNPDPLLACGTRAASMFRAWECSMACLSQAHPEALPAAGGGGIAITLVSVMDPERGGFKVSVAQPIQGGSGARPMKDGMDCADFSAYIRNIPNETLEADMPLLVERYQYREGSPGAGQYRGGCGIDFAMRMFAPDTILTARGQERYIFHPWGRKGGSVGTRAECSLVPAGSDEPKTLGKIDYLTLQPGDVVRFESVGGAGFGDPLERDPARVLDDVRADMLTTEQARDLYGVVIADGQVDSSRTEARRARLRTDRPPLQEFSLGPAREHHEAVWTRAVQDEVNRLLARQPRALWTYLRKKLSEEVERRYRGAGVPTAEELAEIMDGILARSETQTYL